MHRYSKQELRRRRKIYRLKVTILFIFVGVLVVAGSSVLAQKLFKGGKNVQVNAQVQEAEGKDNNQTKQKQDNLDLMKAYLPLGKDPAADDVAFIEKYLQQQYRGQKPDGADGKKVVYLTFDDGPSENITPEILDTLKKEKVKATFFVLGRSIDKSEKTKEILKREVKEGHAIGNHTYSHNYAHLYPHRTVNVHNFMKEVDETNISLKNVLGDNFSTRAIRFPGGHMSWHGVEAIDRALAQKDYHQVDWNTLTKDAEGKYKNATELIEEVKNGVRGREKAIILIHDAAGKTESAKALPEIIDYLKEQGYEFRTMK